MFLCLLEGNQQLCWPNQSLPELHSWSYYFPARDSPLHLYQHFQYGDRVPWPARDTYQGGGGQQPGLQLLFLCWDDFETVSLWLSSLCQWWIQRLWWLYRLFGVIIRLKVCRTNYNAIYCRGAELYNGIVYGVSEEGSGLSVLRTFRLLRILKLVRFLPNLRRQLIVMLKTMDNVAVFFGLLSLFIFIFRYVNIGKIYR